MTDSFSKRIAQSAKAKKSRIIVALDPAAGGTWEDADCVDPHPVLCRLP